MQITLTELRQLIQRLVKEQGSASKGSKLVKSQLPGPRLTKLDTHPDDEEQEEFSGEDGEMEPPGDLDS